MTLRAIVLDFDGVIVESNEIKHQAFFDLFSHYPLHFDEIMVYHRTHNAVDRHQKFRYIMENIMKVPYSQNLADEWAIQYAALTRKKIIACPYVAGAHEFLMEFQNMLPLFLASATPQDELEIIVKERGLTPFFRSIYGAPVKKPEIFRQIAQKEQLAPKEILFIGDSHEDYESARMFGCRFIARISGYPFSNEETERFHDLYEIRTYIVKTLMGRG